MRRLFLAIALCALALPAWAAGFWIPAGDRTDMVHDESRGRIYIANANKILRYELASNRYLGAITLGGKIGSLDLSLNHRTLLATDWYANRLVLVDLDTLQVKSVVPVMPGRVGYGTYSAAYGHGGRIYLTCMLSPGLYGQARLLAFTPTSGAWTDLGGVESSTLLVASGDRRTIAFAEYNRSDGPWGVIDVATGTVFRRDGYTNGTSRQNGEIGLDAHGLQFSVPTDVGTYVYDAAFSRIKLLGPTMQDRPAGVVYHPVEPLVYYPWLGSTGVRAYDTATMLQAGGYDMGRAPAPTQSPAFGNGHARISRDGSLLMVSVPDGIHVHRQYGELRARAISLSVDEGRPHAITLPATIGNGGKLAFAIARGPLHGSVSLAGNVATYTPAPGYLGADEFVFSVKYGLSERQAYVSLLVDRPHIADGGGR